MMMYEENICPICLDECKDTFETQCSHKYCQSCIQKVPRTSQALEEGIITIGVACPLCREFVALPSQTQVIDPETGSCDKLVYGTTVCIGVGLVGGTSTGFLYILFSLSNNTDPFLDTYNMFLLILSGIVLLWIAGIIGIIRRSIHL